MICFKQVVKFGEYFQGKLEDLVCGPWSAGLPYVCRWENGWTYSRMLKVFGSGCYIHKHVSGWLVFKDVSAFRQFVKDSKFPKIEE